MRPELSIISFISFILCLVIVALLFRRTLRPNTPICLLTAWLIIVHLVHGINSAIWLDNERITASTWCDIVTKVLLGAIVAIPSNCISITRHTATETEDDVYLTSRNRKLVDIALGIVIPIIFMCLHPIVQDYRFLIIEDLGCVASIHPSVAALLIFWLPLVFVCCGTLVFSGILLRKFRRNTHRYAPKIAYIQLSFALFATTMTLIIALIHIFTPSQLQDWTSWSSVHEFFFDVKVVHTPISSVEATWWLLFITTLAFFALVAASTREKKRSILPMQQSPLSPDSMRDRRSSLSIPRPEPVHQLNSGWDSMLDSSPTRRMPLSPTSKFRIKSVLSLHRKGSPTPSVSSTAEDDNVFTEATMSYLVSHTAHALGLATPTPPAFPLPPSTPTRSIRTPPPSPVIPPRSPYTPLIPITPPAITHTRPSVDTYATESLAGLDVPEDARSTISVILTNEWPLPPPSTPPTPRSPTTPRHMSTSSTDTYGYAVYPIPERPTSPFQDSFTSIVETRPLEVVGKGLGVKKQSLRKKRSPPGHIQGVMMSVVQETC